jgi:hypothetical protein
VPGCQKLSFCVFLRRNPPQTPHVRTATRNTLLEPHRSVPSGTPCEFTGRVCLGSRLLLGEAEMGPGHRQNGGQQQERHLDATRNRQLDPKGAGEEPGRNRALGALAQSLDGSCTGADGPVPREKCCFVSPVVVQTRAVCAVLQLAMIREHHSRMVQKRVVQVQQASPLGKPSPY